jgi:hypothetical protein
MQERRDDRRLKRLRQQRLVSERCHPGGYAALVLGVYRASRAGQVEDHKANPRIRIQA